MFDPIEYMFHDIDRLSIYALDSDIVWVLCCKGGCPFNKRAGFHAFPMWHTTSSNRMKNTIHPSIQLTIFYSSNLRPQTPFLLVVGHWVYTSCPMVGDAEPPGRRLLDTPCCRGGGNPAATTCLVRPVRS